MVAPEKERKKERKKKEEKRKKEGKTMTGVKNRISSLYICHITSMHIYVCGSQIRQILSLRRYFCFIQVRVSLIKIHTTSEQPA